MNISDLEYQSPLGKSDHSVLIFKYRCYAELVEKDTVKLLYDKTDYEGLNKEIKELDWKSILPDDEKDINESWTKFHEKLSELEHKYVPKIKIRQNKKHNMFPLDETAKTLVKKKHIMSRNMMKNNTDETRRAYNKIRNKVKNAMKKLRKDFEKNLAKEAKNNPKKIWKYINSKSKVKVGIGELYTDPANTKSETTEDDGACKPDFPPKTPTPRPVEEHSSSPDGKRKRHWKTYWMLQNLGFKSKSLSLRRVLPWGAHVGGGPPPRRGTPTEGPGYRLTPLCHLQGTTLARPMGSLRSEKGLLLGRGPQRAAFSGPSPLSYHPEYTITVNSTQWVFCSLPPLKAFEIHKK